MPGYVESLSGSAETGSDSDSDSNAGVAGYVDAEVVLLSEVEEESHSSE